MKAQDYFYALADRLQSHIQVGEVFTCWYSGEESDFVRFNKSKIRQAGSVNQGLISVNLIKNQRQSSFEFGLSGDIERDGKTLEKLFSEQRKHVKHLPADPHVLFSESVHSSESTHESQLSSSESVVDQVLSLSKNLDLVGIFAQGPVYRGFANSMGQRNWFSKHTFNLDYSIYLRDDKAIKADYAGFVFEQNHLEREFELVQDKLKVLREPAQALKPGKYRVYLAPSAVNELVGILNWGAFSEKAFQTKQSPLSKMRDSAARFNPMFSLGESTAQGAGPLFQAQGFMKPGNVSLIQNGKLTNSLISPRTAKEYGLHTNGANASESPEAFELRAGDLSRNDVLKKLDTGIFIGNLWYLNYSEWQSARITGMTRFACFWVENGEIKKPLNVMRFDDSLYSIFGDNLEALTKESDFILDPQTYGERSTCSAHLPGALVKEFRLTL
ncbi:MAG: TldE/PmbA family protein [Deltaproteobacteria bacterium]|nr:TldE/PmbA family protein [Deltaproteobacteria bacterium]